MEGSAGTHAASDDTASIDTTCTDRTLVTQIGHGNSATNTTDRFSNQTRIGCTNDRTSFVENKVLNGARRLNVTKETSTIDIQLNIEVADFMALAIECASKVDAVETDGCPIGTHLSHVDICYQTTQSIWITRIYIAREPSKFLAIADVVVALCIRLHETFLLGTADSANAILEVMVRNLSLNRRIIREASCFADNFAVATQFNIGVYLSSFAFVVWTSIGTNVLSPTDDTLVTVHPEASFS